MNGPRRASRLPGLFLPSRRRMTNQAERELSFIVVRIDSTASCMLAAMLSPDPRFMKKHSTILVPL